MDWRMYAACLSEDPELFYPVAEPGTAIYRDQVARAQALCQACPVKASCLADAFDYEMQTGAPFGVRGGLTAEDRAAAIRHRTRAAATAA